MDAKMASDGITITADNEDLARIYKLTCDAMELFVESRFFSGSSGSSVRPLASSKIFLSSIPLTPTPPAPQKFAQSCY